MNRAAIQQRVDLWQQRLRLGNWEISIDWDRPSAETALASIARAHDYERANIRFASNFEDWTLEECQIPNDDDRAMPPQSLDRVIVHELLHCSLNDLGEAGKIQWGFVNKQVDELHEAQLDKELERDVERMAVVIVEAWEHAVAL